MRTTSTPDIARPSTNALSSAGELNLPSRPTATRLPPLSPTTAAKLRPIARASASCSVWPTTPRMSYSRRMVGSKTWPSAIRVTDSASRILLDEVLDRRAQLRPHQGKREIGLEEADLVAAVETPTGEPEAVERLLGGDQLCQRVGKLDFAASTLADAAERIEHVGLKDITADDAQTRRRLGRFGFLDNTARHDQPAVILLNIEDAVAVGLLVRHFHRRHHVTADLGLRLDHLLKARLFRQDEIVGQEHGEGFVADQRARTPHGVAETERMLLPRIGDLSGLRHPRFDVGDLGLLAACLQRAFELVRMVEVILNRALGATGDEDELLDTRRARFLNRILDQGLVDDGQHFLGHGLGSRKESGAEATDRKHCFANALHHAPAPPPSCWPLLYCFPALIQSQIVANLGLAVTIRRTTQAPSKMSFAWLSLAAR